MIIFVMSDSQLWSGSLANQKLGIGPSKKIWKKSKKCGPQKFGGQKFLITDFLKILGTHLVKQKNVGTQPGHRTFGFQAL
jgi:hypothetical protein